MKLKEQTTYRYMMMGAQFFLYIKEIYSEFEIHYYDINPTKTHYRVSDDVDMMNAIDNIDIEPISRKDKYTIIQRLLTNPVRTVDI